MRKWFSLLVCACLLVLFAGIGLAEGTAAQTHNFILIIDNSLSTTGRHSLGGATDPDGLRFDAARLVYENVISSDSAAGQGQIGVIIFCGPENCVSYGPMDINAGPAALNETIGQHLTEAANQDRRDNYTDIRTALDTARDMLRPFEGRTSVILLTDGVNDLTNRADPFNAPENIEANDQSVAIVADMRTLGADFYIIALTAQDSVRNTDTFMAFINRMAEAGGGEPLENGGFNNVLMATQADLNSKLLQMLIRAENTAAATIQNDILYTPLKWPFTIPYSGISSATVNITFMPEDKRRLEAIELTAPDGTTHDLYDRDGAHPRDGIGVTDDRSYIILDIPAPQPGEWSVSVTSRNDERVPVNTVIRFNHQLKIRVDVPEPIHAGEPQRFSAWFQRYNGTKYEDLTDSDIYALSTVTLTLLGPSANSRPQAVTMKRKGSQFSTTLKLKTPGTWLAEVKAQNDYWLDRVNDIAFEVLPAPTATPTPTTTPTETPIPTSTVTIEPTLTPEAPVESLIVKNESEDGDFFWQVDADPDAEQLVVSWTGNGADAAEAVLMAGGSETPVFTGIHSGDAIDLSELDAEIGYTLLLTGFSDTSGEGGPLPIIQGLDIQLVPDVNAIGDAVLSVANAMVVLGPSALNSENIQSAIQMAKGLTQDIDASVQQLQSVGNIVSQAAGQPLDAVVAGLTLDQTGEVDSAFSPIPATEPTVTPTPSPTPTPTSFTDILKASWVYLVGGVGLLAAIAGVAMLILQRSGERVTGNLKIECDEINLEKVFRFEGRGSLKVGSPLNTYPDIAKLKRGKVFDVLSHLSVGMAKADAYGKAPNSDVQHIAYEPLIHIVYTDPRTRRVESLYIGRNDIGESELSVWDAGKLYKLTFSGNLSFDELIHTGR